MKYYEYKDCLFAESVANARCAQLGITLADCAEYVRCKDGILRIANTVSPEDLWINPKLPDNSDLID